VFLAECTSPASSTELASGWGGRRPGRKTVRLGRAGIIAEGGAAMNQGGECACQTCDECASQMSGEPTLSGVGGIFVRASDGW
jgi:hypothetical protein